MNSLRNSFVSDTAVPCKGHIVNAPSARHVATTHHLLQNCAKCVGQDGPARWARDGVIGTHLVLSVLSVKLYRATSAISELGNACRNSVIQEKRDSAVRYRLTPVECPITGHRGCFPLTI